MAGRKSYNTGICIIGRVSKLKRVEKYWGC